MDYIKANLEGTLCWKIRLANGAARVLIQL